MSAVSDFFTQPGFWWGVPLGAVVAGVAGPLITARSVRASDARKATQENRQSNQKILRETATAFCEVCSGIIEKAIDSKGVFNVIRDAAATAERMPDPKELEKISFATDLMDEMKKVTTAFNNLKLVAPVDVLEKATTLNAAMIALTSATTQPLSKPPLMREAGKAFDGFSNAVRAALDLEAFTPEDAQRAAASYIETLQNQVTAYIKETEDEARRLGLLDVDKLEIVPSEVEIRAPDSVGIRKITAEELTTEDIGRSIGMRDPVSGFNYGAQITGVAHDRSSTKPGVLLTLRHPPIPGFSPEREETARIHFKQDLEILEIPAK